MEVENWKWKDEKLQNEERTFFYFISFFIFYFLFLFYLILFYFIFFLLFTFQNHLNLFWVYQNGNFLPGKGISLREKIGKNNFAPSEKYSSYAPDPKDMA